MKLYLIYHTVRAVPGAHPFPRLRQLRSWLGKHGIDGGWTHFLDQNGSIVSARELPKEEVVHALDA